MRPPILPDTPLNFSDYFRLSAEIEDILACLGCSFEAKSCELPRKELDATRLRETRARLEEGLPCLSLTSEAARREFLIAPVLWEAVHFTRAKIKVEYPLEVGPQLKGTVDFFLRAQHHVLIVEAKNGDLQRGFTQLAVELIALAEWLGEEKGDALLYGAVSMGDAWRFGILDRGAKHVTQDLRLYTVPDDFEELLEILVAVLTDGRRVPPGSPQGAAG
ncbi:MAG: PD-(D/E)XK nuclease family protein [bacterium]|nr:PD-(D/E)XK nuclease family protein [bacterium]